MKCLSRNDLSTIINGRKQTNSFPAIHSPFDIAFNPQKNKEAWRKCGAVPLTRCILTDESVRDEISDGVSTFKYNPDEPLDL